MKIEWNSSPREVSNMTEAKDIHALGRITRSIQIETPLPGMI